MDATRQIFRISKFPDTLSFVIMPGNVLAKSDENRSYLYTLQIHSKWMYSSQNHMRDFSSQRLVDNSRHARRLCGLLKPQTYGTTGPSGVNDGGSRFPGKVAHFRHVF